MADENEDTPWWRQKRWSIPGMLLLVLVAADLVAAFRLVSDKDLRSSILGLLIPLVAMIAGVAALLNFQEARRQNERTFETTQHQLKLARDQVTQAQERSQEQMELQRRGQVTERFTKAIEQLGSEKLDVRIGAIYALEQIARDSEDLHWPVMQIITTYLREHSTGMVEGAAEQKEGKEEAVMEGVVAPSQASEASADFLAVAAVIRRRRWEWDPVVSRLWEPEAVSDEAGPVWREPLNLKACDLRRADLRQAQLERANLEGAQLQGAYFGGAQLQGAKFKRAQLEWADFWGAQLKGARFDGAQLEWSNFEGAQAQGASFLAAQLNGANFQRARMKSVRFDETQVHEVWFGEAELQGASFMRAHLQGARFDRAQLQGAYFGGAQLLGANFEGAQLKRSNFEGVNLTQTFGLTQKQLDSAICDGETEVSRGLTIKRVDSEETDAS